MKSLIVFATVLITFIGKAQPVKSDVYTWKNLPLEKRETSERRQILEGSGPVMSNLEIHATTIEPGKSAHPSHKHAEEELLLVKEGTLKVTINNKSQVLGPGSIAFAISGDEHGAENVGTTKATYYVIKYRAKDSVNIKRAKDAGGSFMINWNDIAFNQHDKGGIRRYIERPTATINRFEMHVTTLNAGLKSHDPHTHKAEEIVLMIDGNAEMQIENDHKKATTGDLIYLGSNVSHAIRNDDTKPIMYFAFQWD